MRDDATGQALHYCVDMTVNYVMPPMTRHDAINVFDGWVMGLLKEDISAWAVCSAITHNNTWLDSF